MRPLADLRRVVLNLDDAAAVHRRHGIGPAASLGAMTQAKRHAYSSRLARRRHPPILLRRLSVPAHRRDRLTDEIEVIGVHGRGAFSYELTSQQHVLLAKLRRVDGQLARHAVHGALDPPGSLHLPRSPGVACRDFIRVSAAGLDAQVRYAIAAPGRDHRVVRRRGAPGRIGAGIHRQIDGQRRQCPVQLDAHLCLIDHGVAGGLPKALLCCWNQLDGPADSTREKQRGQHRVRDDLGAEAAPDVRHADAHPIGIQAEKMGDLLGIPERGAGRRPEIDLVV